MSAALTVLQNLALSNVSSLVFQNSLYGSGFHQEIEGTHTKTFNTENSLRERLTGVRAAFKEAAREGKVNPAGTREQREATTATKLEGTRVRYNVTGSL